MRNLLPLFPILVLVLGIAASLLLLDVLGNRIAEGPADSSPQMATELPAAVAAQADLARKHSVLVGEIKIISLQAVDWPDTSLGCPQEGQAYAQVITPGYRVTLEHQGIRYEYHTDRSATASETRVIDCTANPT